jgi:hypothetical protein
MGKKRNKTAFPCSKSEVEILKRGYCRNGLLRQNFLLKMDKIGRIATEKTNLKMEALHSFAYILTKFEL